MACVTAPVAVRGHGVEGRVDGRRRFETLCAPQRENILRYVKWLSRDIDAAQDIVQAALLRAWRSIHTLADDRAVTAWLQTIARRELARFYARRRMESDRLAALTPVDELDGSLEDTMAVGDLQTVLESMKYGDRRILFESMWGYSAEEMATSTGCTLGQARMRLFRARRRLRCLVS
jgi:RNA polymerase sigma-70 factor (ECF subfamily)